MRSPRDRPLSFRYDNDLRLVDRRKGIHRFQLDNSQVFHQEIDPARNIQFHAIKQSVRFSFVNFQRS